MLSCNICSLSNVDDNCIMLTEVNRLGDNDSIVTYDNIVVCIKCSSGKSLLDILRITCLDFPRTDS